MRSTPELSNKSLVRGQNVFALLSKFLTGQAAVQLINMAVGIAIIWLLPIVDYALYVFALTLLTSAPIIINMGISQAIITLGSRRENPDYFGSLLVSALRVSFVRYWFVAAMIIPLSIFMGYKNQAWSSTESIFIVISIVGACWLQNKVSILQSFLHIKQDQNKLLVSGLVGAIVRALLLLPLTLYPSAFLALIGNVCSMLVMYLVLQIYVSRISKVCKEDLSTTEVIRDFVRPLFLVVIYFALQGQIALFILGYQGQTVFLAEVGALSRFLQIVSILMVLNPFYIQPVFARLNNFWLFIKYLAGLYFLLAVFSIAVLTSSFYFPRIWLFILGENYSHLGAEVPLALGYALLSLIGATLYTVVIARGSTKNQYLAMLLGVLAQIGFLWISGVHSTTDALYFNLLPPLLYAIVQTCLLVSIIFGWNLTRRSVV